MRPLLAAAVLLALAACARPDPFPWWRHDTPVERARADNAACTEAAFAEEGYQPRNMDAVIAHTHGCMLEKGYDFAPRWHRVPGSEAGDGSLVADRVACDALHDLGRDPAAWVGYRACMAERGWTRLEP